MLLVARDLSFPQNEHSGIALAEQTLQNGARIVNAQAWETPFPRSRMSASIEKFIKASCLSERSGIELAEPSTPQQPAQLSGT